MVIVLNDYFVHSCWDLHLNFRFLQTGGSLAPLSFVLWTVIKLLCSCLCLLDAIIELHAMDEKCSKTFLLQGESEFYM